jgi:hypothetical protein
MLVLVKHTPVHLHAKCTRTLLSRHTAQLSPPPWQPEFLGVCQYTRLHLPALWTRHLRTHRSRRIVVEKGPVEFCEGGFLQVTFDSFKVIELELWHVDESCDNREPSSNCICAVSTMSKQRFTNTMLIIRSPPLLSNEVAVFPFLPMIWNVP